MPLDHRFGSPEEHRLYHPGPREPRIEGNLRLTQEQVLLSDEMLESLVAKLKDYEFRGQAVWTPVGPELSGTDQRLFSFSASTNFFNHPHVGAARTDPNDTHW